jgi:hypothetical protein
MEPQSYSRSGGKISNILLGVSFWKIKLINFC